MEGFREVQDVIPRNAFMAFAFILVATDAFILACVLLGAGTPAWMFWATTATFAAVLLACATVKLRVSIDDSDITVSLVRTRRIPLGDVIDWKIGDMGSIRSYSGWGMDGVRFSSFATAGSERGISLKVAGKRVVSISLVDPEGFAASLPGGGERLY
ncbi:MAG: hypothetical protein LBG62_03585 [Candidatus Methanoplasma sp.]|jgi:hypothetical protein|nr:hypothetical protein [Candidatus Methanoplasma sp.]